MSSEEESKSFQEIAAELKEMVRLDQEMRNKIKIARAEGKDEMYYFDASIDLRNTERMKEIIGQIGWPTISLVGENASHDAWLLVQHSDHDTEFQKKCLELMEEAPDGEVNKRNIAYLTDRIAVHSGQPQIYGTQFSTSENGELTMGNVIDPENLDKRRKEVGLNPFADYLERSTKYYSE